jgi:ABC-type antimicrobial peptide transport system permease subunit
MCKKENDITLDRNWCKEQVERLSAWEILRRYVLHETRIPMTNAELCDTIGVSSTYTIRLLKSVHNRLESKNDK